MGECCNIVGENDVTKLEIQLRLLFKIINCGKIYADLFLDDFLKIFFESSTYKMKLLNYSEYMSLSDDSWQQKHGL